MPKYESNDDIRKIEILYDKGTIGIKRPEKISAFLDKADDLNGSITTKEHLLSRVSIGPSFPMDYTYKFESLTGGRVWTQTIKFDFSADITPIITITNSQEWTLKEKGLIDAVIFSLINLRNENEVTKAELIYV